MRATTSASNFFRRVLCPGSANAEEGQPEIESPFQARATGVLLHYKDAFGEEAEKVSQQEILDRNRKLREYAMRSGLERLGIPTETEAVIIREQEYSVCDDEGKPVIPGHPDLIIWYPEHKLLFVWDSKFGRKLVPLAESNLQLRCYIVALCDERFGDFEAEQIYGGITQPFAYPSMHMASYTRDQIEPARRELMAYYNATLSPDAPRRASLDACSYCKARATCPEARKLWTELMRLKISEVPLPQLEQMADSVAMVEGTIQAYWERLEFIAKEFPHLLSRFELGPGRTTSRITNAEAAMHSLCDSLGGSLLSYPQFWETVKISIPQIVEAVAKNLRCSTDDAKSKVEAALEGYIEKNEGKQILREKPKLPISNEQHHLTSGV